MRVVGRTGGDGPTVHLGRYRAWDGSAGDPIALDVDGPHAVAVVGKRGTGKSYTLGVLSEAIDATAGLVPIVLDPMAAIGGTAANRVRPRVRSTSIPPRSWPDLVGLQPSTPAGTLVWRAAAETDTLAAMCTFVERADVDPAVRRAAENHLGVAAAWDVFGADGLTRSDLFASGAVIDLAGLDAAPTNAVARAVMETVYRTSLRDDTPLPWVVVDEAHVLFEGVARPVLDRLLTRGRQPGISLVLATQRPTALPDVVVSQADVILAHRVTGTADRRRLVEARPAYLTEALATRLPERPGDALLIDDATEDVHPITVRERNHPHAGDSPRLSETTARVAGDSP